MSQDRIYHQVLEVVGPERAHNFTMGVENTSDSTIAIVGPWSNLDDGTLHIPGIWVNERDSKRRLIGGGVKGRQARAGSVLVVSSDPVDLVAERTKRGITSRRKNR